MRLYWRNEPLFSANAAEVTAETDLIRASTGRPLRYMTRIHVRGFIEGNGQRELTEKEVELRRKLLNAYGDLSLRRDDGQQSGLTIDTRASITGVVIDRGPSFREAQGSEYVNRRTVEFSGVAEYVIPGSEPAIVSFTETFTYTGTCDPIQTWRQAVNARPVLQIVSPGSTMRVVQSGRAVGHLVRPNPPPPRWPFPIELRHHRRIVHTTGRRVGPRGGDVIEPVVEWTYEYESNTPLVALPTVVPW